MDQAGLFLHPHTNCLYSAASCPITSPHVTRVCVWVGVCDGRSQMVVVGWGVGIYIESRLCAVGRVRMGDMTYGGEKIPGGIK